MFHIENSFIVFNPYLMQKLCFCKNAKYLLTETLIRITVPQKKDCKISKSYLMLLKIGTNNVFFELKTKMKNTS